MNKTIIAISVIIIILLLCVASLFETYYTRKAEVIKIENTLITVEDKPGNWWSFYGEGFEIGDKVTLIMTTKDNQIIRVRN